MDFDWSVTENMSIYLIYFPLFDFAKEHIYVLTCNKASPGYCTVYSNVTADSQWQNCVFMQFWVKLLSLICL